MNKNDTNYQAIITNQAKALGYDLVGFTGLNLEEKDRTNLIEFVNQGVAGEMHWFGHHLNLRLNPAKLYEQSLGAIVLGLYYRHQKGEEILKKAKVRISRYAHGKDYHRVLRKKAKKLLQNLQNQIPGIKGRICVDSAPIPEKILGRMAGLGWQGKHTNLIHPQIGSYFFLNVILVNIPFNPIEKITDQCRDCRLCLDACPTEALSPERPYQIDARQCLSYLTIEHKSEIPIKLQKKISGWAFGCDICQEVCPYNCNRKSRDLDITEKNFHIDKRISNLILEGKLPSQTTMTWQQWSQGSPLRRVSEKKMHTNLDLAK